MEQYRSKYTTYSESEENFDFDKKYLSFQNIIFLKTDKNQEEAQIGFLNQILSSVGISGGDNAAIITMQTEAEAALRDFRNSQVSHVLALGVSPVKLGLQGFEKLHHVYELMGMRILFGLPVDQYRDNKNNKSLLWNALKTWKSITP